MTSLGRHLLSIEDLDRPREVAGAASAKRADGQSSEASATTQTSSPSATSWRIEVTER